jgi:hypothetical protein
MMLAAYPRSCRTEEGRHGKNACLEELEPRSGKLERLP